MKFATTTLHAPVVVFYENMCVAVPTIIPHNSPESMVSSMSVRIGRPMEEALLSILRIPLVTSYERVFLILTLN